MRRSWTFWGLLVGGSFVALVGATTGQLELLAGGVLVLIFAGLRAHAAHKTSGRSASPQQPRTRQPAQVATEAGSSSAELGDLLAQAVDANRYALLLRPCMAPSLTEDQRLAAEARLHDAMAVVPQGPVRLSSQVAVTEESSNDDDQHEGYANREESEYHVDGFYVDRYTITNRQYKQFVDAGGYEQIENWQREIWPAVVDFVDHTGRPGPRFWQNGCYEAGKGDHPVVGVSWYEAAAYCQWVGKSLPSDAQWVKAASWPVQLSAGRLAQRRYPWGDTMDPSHANVWCAGVGQTVAVHKFGDGASVGGAYQMIGNVWEWTLDDVGQPVETAMIAGGDLILAAPMKSIRGGAFDTYFDNQATCHFRSAERHMSRKHNIGFRCVLDAQHVAGSSPGTQAPSACESPADAIDQIDNPAMPEEVLV